LDPWSNLSDVSLLSRRKMLMMWMMVELIVSWISVEVEEVKKDLLEMVGLLGFQMVESVRPIRLTCWLPLPMLLLLLPPIWLMACWLIFLYVQSLPPTFSPCLPPPPSITPSSIL
jgi:hypothetical protein